MSAGTRFTSTNLIENVLKPHTQLSIDLLRLVKRRRIGSSMRISSDDPTTRFQIAAVIVFLAGIDKALSLTCQLLYLAGAVEWKWLVGNGRVEPGRVTCYPGLMAKINKLHALGLDLSGLKWLIEIRNRYIHECTIFAGYQIGLSKTPRRGLEVKAHGPAIECSSNPVASLSENELKLWTLSLTTQLGQFLDKSKWKTSWRAISRQIENLPVNPRPEFIELRKRWDKTRDSLDDIFALLTSLNNRYVGIGLTLVMGNQKGG